MLVRADGDLDVASVDTPQGAGWQPIPGLAFSYNDKSHWQFDGNDIVAVSRTSWDGDTYHNANYLTFHRLLNFRSASRSMDQ